SRRGSTTRPSAGNPHHKPHSVTTVSLDLKSSDAPAVNSLDGLNEVLYTLRRKTQTVLDVLSGHEMNTWVIPAELSPAQRRRDLALIRAVHFQGDWLLSLAEDVRRGVCKILATDPSSWVRRDWAARIEQRLRDDYPSSLSWANMNIHPVRATLFDLELDHSNIVRHRYEQLVGYGTTVVGLLDELLKADIFREPAGLPMDKIDDLHHSRFEKLIGDLMDRDGYRVVRSGGGAGDQGADVLALDGLDHTIMIQAKHFTGGSGSVGQPVVQHLYGGAMAVHPSALPIVVTNGEFTGLAKVWAAENSRVHLVGREELRRWAEEAETLEDVLKGTGPA
ncbi:restriction endonuclease, partial [Streptomyces avidinii]|uniref:restriction endonuclease n=1 Tax=Streptomyces avidinii TaxID=1895 RepID=UPI0037B775B9